MNFRQRIISQAPNQLFMKQKQYLPKKQETDQWISPFNKTAPRQFSSADFKSQMSFMHNTGGFRSPPPNPMKNLLVINKQTNRIFKNTSPEFGFKETGPRTRRRMVSEAQEKRFSEQLNQFPAFNVQKFNTNHPVNLNFSNKKTQKIEDFSKNLSSITMNTQSTIKPFEQINFKNPLPKVVSPFKNTTKKQKIQLKNQLLQQLSKNNIFQSLKGSNKNIELPVTPQKPKSKINQFQQHSPLLTTSVSSFAPPRNRRIAAPQKQQIKIKKSDFQIGKTLGKGQYGQVMIVRHKKTGFMCAMKVMSKKVIRQENYINQIVRQLSIQFYLSHRNIAPLYGYFYDEQNVYLLVEFCEGGQLYSKIKKQRKLQQKQTSMIIKQVLQGLDFIHKLQIIHRDLKPQNILFNYEMVKISDFGWAVFSNQGLRKTVSGSPLYYPPQIVKGQHYDEKIDLWNVGMMTYECLLGKIPFRIYSELDLDKIVSDQITFPEYVDVSDTAKDFILKTMRKNAQERMQIRQMLRHKFIKQYDQKEIIPGLQQDFNKLML